MKYLKIDIQSIRIKGDLEDEETLQADVYEKLQAMIESETLTFTIDEDFEEDDDN
jgi:hypothetical protein